MKKKLLLSSLIITGALVYAEAPVISQKKVEVKEKQKKTVRTVINKIVATIYTFDEPIIITLLDITRKSLDGRTRTLDDLIDELLMYYEALEVYRMNVSEDQVERHLASIREQNGIDNKEIEVLFAKEGYTFEEGKEELRRSYAIQQLLHELIVKHLTVTEKEARAYYKNNPTYDVAEYRVKKGFIVREAITDKELKSIVEDGLNEDDVEWSDAYWLKESELADHVQFITSMRPGETSKPEKVEGGYSVVKLIKRRKSRKRSFEESFADISNILRAPKYDQMMSDYKKKLREKYEIVEYK